MGVVASTSPYFAHLREFLSNARRALVRARLCVCVTRTMGLAKYEKKRLLETASSSTCRAHELLLTSDDSRRFFIFLARREDDAASIKLVAGRTRTSDSRRDTLKNHV